MKLRRTVPFLVTSTGSGLPVLLVDTVEVPMTAGPETLRRIEGPLSLGDPAACLSAAEAERLVGDQYDACLEYIYSHPWWARLRAGQDADRLGAYLLETRHYLAAAPFRMASGIPATLAPTELSRLQAHHVVEEADHDTYFENGLAATGADRAVVRAARPSPVTLEWIHLMRHVAALGALEAAVCSGLLETTARDTEAVRGWHDMLVREGMLGPESVRAVFEHVETDLGLGHGQNWRDALRAARVVPAEQLAGCLNAATIVAEMIVRWLDSLRTCLSTEVAALLPDLTAGAEPPRPLSGEADGLPVWPSGVLSAVVHGPDGDRRGTRQVLGAAYAFGGRTDPVATGPAAGGVLTAAAELTARLRVDDPPGAAEDVATLEKRVGQWMTAVDGHPLWDEMVTTPTPALVYGWLLENHHYIAAIWQHNGAAVAACPDPVLRGQLVHHLVEEFQHGRMIRRGLTAAGGRHFPALDPTRARPLPTTVAFFGTLRELGQRDWKAYVLALCFLQLTLGTEGGRTAGRHSRFYTAVLDRLPEAADILAPMRKHDAEDTGHGHGQDVREMLAALAERHPVGPESLAAAALVPQLAWSFLDGILQHYRRGDAAVGQRMGWHTAS